MYQVHISSEILLSVFCWYKQLKQYISCRHKLPKYKGLSVKEKKKKSKAEPGVAVLDVNMEC